MLKKKILAIITARGNSKGLLNKNLRTLNRKPLIYYPINAALNSKFIDDTIVSTDSPKIAKISKKYGAIVPFLRPDIIAQDKSTSFSVIKHAINYLHSQKKKYEYFVLLEPTSPFTTNKDIDLAIKKLLNDPKAKSIVGVSKIEGQHPVFSARINNQGFLKPYLSNKFKFYRRQDISDLYFFDGSLYISRVDKYLDEKSFYHKRTLPYFFPKWKSFEIDNISDLFLMRSIYKNKKYFKNEN